MLEHIERAEREAREAMGRVSAARLRLQRYLARLGVNEPPSPGSAWKTTSEAVRDLHRSLLPRGRGIPAARSHDGQLPGSYRLHPEFGTASELMQPGALRRAHVGGGGSSAGAGGVTCGGANFRKYTPLVAQLHRRGFQDRGFQILTEVVQELEDGTEVIYDARRYRKGRRPTIVPRTPSAELAEKAERRLEEGARREPPLRLCAWRPRSVPYWVSVHFLFGGIFFVVGSYAWMVPGLGDSEHGAPLWSVTLWVTYPYLAGSIAFLLGCYLAFVEVINANLGEELDALHPSGSAHAVGSVHRAVRSRSRVGSVVASRRESKDLELGGRSRRSSKEELPTRSRTGSIEGNATRSRRSSREEHARSDGPEAREAAGTHRRPSDPSTVSFERPEEAARRLTGHAHRPAAPSEPRRTFEENPPPPRLSFEYSEPRPAAAARPPNLPLRAESLPPPPTPTLAASPLTGRPPSPLRSAMRPAGLSSPLLRSPSSPAFRPSPLSPERPPRFSLEEGEPPPAPPRTPIPRTATPGTLRIPSSGSSFLSVGEIEGELVIVDTSSYGEWLQGLYWWRWQPNSLMWWGALVQLVGAVAFEVSCVAGMPGLVSTQQEERLYVHWPSLAGSLMFTFACFVYLLESTNSSPFTIPQTPSIGYYICQANLWGSVLFTTASLSYFMADFEHGASTPTGFLWSEWGVRFGFGTGSLLFVIGAQLGLIEVQSDD